MKKAQALISLLIFTAMASTLTAGAVAVTIINSQSTTKFSQGEQTYHLAEAAMENAILRLIRDRTYTGETVALDDGSATITVSGSSTLTITAESSKGNYKRKIEVVGQFVNNSFSISSWKEI